MRPRPRATTIALVAVTVLALGGATWLFLRGDEPAPKKTSTKSSKDEPAIDQADPVLSLPDDEDPTDTRRRGEDGRDRIEDKPEDEAAASTPELPAELRAVKGATVALQPAASDEQDPDRRVAVGGGEKVPCAHESSAPAASLESDVTARVAMLLERAGATVALGTTAGCADTRAKRLDDADVAVVVVVDDRGRVMTWPGRPAADLDDASSRASRRLAAELATALDAGPTRLPTGTPGWDVVGRTGAVDLPGGAAVALVELDAAALADEPARDALALALATGIARAAARADVVDG
jgi:hypothetical protein